MKQIKSTETTQAGRLSLSLGAVCIKSIDFPSSYQQNAWLGNEHDMVPGANP